MAKKRIIILGAGLAGLSAAWHLQRKGIECHIFEKEAEAGGLCRSKKINGFTFDYCGHLLHFKNHFIFSLINGLVKGNLRMHKRSAWIYSYGRYIPYPFQANLHCLPAQVRKECLKEFSLAVADKKKGESGKNNFLSWINYTFGKGIARHFMIPYNRKFWTVHPSALTCEWINGFIPILKAETLSSAGSLGSGSLGYNARFWYPAKESISQIPLAFASGLKNLHTGNEVVEINLKKRQIRTRYAGAERFDYLISTLPLPEMPGLVKGLPKSIRDYCARLRWNSIFNLNLGIGRKDDSGRHWVYFPQKEVSFFRVGSYSSFSPTSSPRGKASFYVELAYSKDRPIDKKNAVARIIRDLRDCGQLSSSDNILTRDVNDIIYGYPIYDSSYHNARNNIVRYLNNKDIIPCGRYGSWRYMSMEDVILEGREVADCF